MYIYLPVRERGATSQEPSETAPGWESENTTFTHRSLSSQPYHLSELLLLPQPLVFSADGESDLYPASLRILART